MELSPSDVSQLLSLPDTYAPSEIGNESENFIVGDKISVSFDLRANQSVKYRHIFIFGDATFKTPDAINDSQSGTLLVDRSLVVFGQLTTDRVNIVAESQVQFGSRCDRERFFRVLRGCVLEWRAMQREKVGKIGLQSILV